MKKTPGILFVAAFLIMTFSAVHLLPADPPAPPTLPGGHGYGDNVPAGAPIDGGVVILLGLGVAYGGRILVKAKNKHLNS
jgi:hypothetical protein